jgi:hypothetical protein
VRTPVTFRVCAQISPQGSGWAIHGHMVKGGVDASEFAEWWLVEDAIEAVTAFVTQNFPGASLVERHGQHARFVCESLVV